MTSFSQSCLEAAAIMQLPIDNHFALEKQKQTCREFTPKVAEQHQQQPPPKYSQDESASVEYKQMHTKQGWKLQAQRPTY